MSDKPQFEIPPQMRDLAENNVEQARQAYAQFMDMARKAQDMMTRSTGAMTESAREVQTKAMRYAQDNVQASFELAADLARAHDLKEAMEIQTRYTQKQMRNYAEQTQDLGRLMTEAAQKIQTR